MPIEYKRDGTLRNGGFLTVEENDKRVKNAQPRAYSITPTTTLSPLLSAHPPACEPTRSPACLPALLASPNDQPACLPASALMASAPPRLTAATVLRYARARDRGYFSVLI